MLSDDTLRNIAKIFCGDIVGYYSYKSGPQLVFFFNQHFGSSDSYGQGFPSRWAYVYDKLASLFNTDRFDLFLNIVLSKEYIMRDCQLSQVDSVKRAFEIFNKLNELVQRDLYLISYSNGTYHLHTENQDLVFIGSGGFANVYLQKSTKRIIKKLKDDFLMDAAILSRFKREFQITMSLQDMPGIIKVYDFDELSCSYSMEPAEQTLEAYIQFPGISDDIRINCIRQILSIMKEVHKRNIIHRDLSPNNIFVIRGSLKIADFGLGKDLNIFTSHQTIHTNALGQYLYCAPEQFMLLKDGDKRSDVYSLGRIINYIMTGDPNISNHIFRNVSEKAANLDSVYRYADAGQLSIYFEKSVLFHQDSQNENAIIDKISRGAFDDEVESFIYELSGEKISKFLLERKKGFSDALLQFMKMDGTHAQHIVQCIDSSYRDVCRHSFEAYDPFASFAYQILRSDFSFVVKEIAASILRYVASDVNRYYAQNLIQRLKDMGIDPMLEEILDS